jgi:hypothetical protein
MLGKKFAEALLRRHSGVTHAQFPPSDFLNNKKKLSTRICSSKNVFRVNIRRPKFFDVFTEWHCIRQEAFAAVLN